MFQVTYKLIRRILVLLVGFTVLLLGAVMLVTPGPGLAAILAGLGILATEVIWARKVLNRLKDETGNFTRGFTGWLKKHFRDELKK